MGIKKSDVTIAFFNIEFLVFILLIIINSEVFSPHK